MKRITLPQPPDAESTLYKNNQQAFNRAVSDWLRRIKGLIEDASRVNDTPMGQPFLATNFTTNTVITGTSTLGDVADCLASLIAAMTARGLISATVSRTT